MPPYSLSLTVETWFSPCIIVLRISPDCPLQFAAAFSTFLAFSLARLSFRTSYNVCLMPTRYFSSSYFPWSSVVEHLPVQWWKKCAVIIQTINLSFSCQSLGLEISVCSSHLHLPVSNTGNIRQCHFEKSTKGINVIWKGRKLKDKRKFIRSLGPFVLNKMGKILARK